MIGVSEGRWTLAGVVGFCTTKSTPHAHHAFEEREHWIVTLHLPNALLYFRRWTLYFKKRLAALASLNSSTIASVTGVPAVYGSCSFRPTFCRISVQPERIHLSKQGYKMSEKILHFWKGLSYFSERNTEFSGNTLLDSSTVHHHLVHHTGPTLSAAAKCSLGAQQMRRAPNHPFR